MKKDVIKVGVIAYPGAQQAAVHGLMDLFRIANKLHKNRKIEDRLIELSVAVVETFTENEFANLDVAVLPPSLAEELPVSDKKLRENLVALSDRDGVLCSVCAGAFLLAETGLLNGRLVTTHWRLSSQFQSRYPNVSLDTDKLIIDDDDIITAGGLMAWVDLGLKLIERYLGSLTMLDTAKFFIVDPGNREQRYYSSFSPPMHHGDDQVLRVQKWLEEHYTQPVSVKDMIKVSGLNDRTFVRRFQKTTRLNPSEYLQNLRVNKAREFLEFTRVSIDEISWKIGYQDPGGVSQNIL